MSKISANFPIEQNFSTRPYQNEAIGETTNFVKELLNGILNFRDGVHFQNASLLEMATGSGKTFTIGKYLEKLIRWRNIHNRRNKTDDYEGLNVLVLSNRIDGVQQFRDDLVHGRKGEKLPILSKNVRENLRVSTFHSKADNIDDLDETYFTQDESDEVEIFSQNNGRKKDNVYFSTYQTANIKDLALKLPYIDLIIIDEAHNVKGESEFMNLIEELNTKGRNGNKPQILPVTATPTDVTKRLFGKPIFNFGLSEYLISEYSPEVEYKLITSSTASVQEIRELQNMIENAKMLTDIRLKKELVRKIEEKFDDIMSKYIDLRSLVNDIIQRIIVDNGEINETIIYANNTSEADEISAKINEITGEEISLSYHSKNDSNKALERLRDKDDKVKIIVAVGKLNESVDLPEVNNIVFFRNTGEERIFIQQFGRGLRGKKVRYYDYVGGIKNFSWIGEIYEKYYKALKHGDTDNFSKFKLIGGNISGKEVSIDLASLGFLILKTRSEIQELTEEDIVNFFKEKDLEYWLGLSDRQNVKINGIGLNLMARIIGISQGDPVSSRKIWYEFLSIIFDIKLEVKELTKDEIVKFFKIRKIEDWLKLGFSQIQSINIDGIGIISIVNTFYGQILSSKNVPKKFFSKFLEDLFEVKIVVDELTRDGVISYFKDDGKTIHDWKNMKKNDRKKIRLKGVTLYSIAKLFGLKGNPENSLTDWYALLERIFGEIIIVQKLTKKDVRDYFKADGKTINDWVKMSSYNRKLIEIKGKKLPSIAGLFGLKGQDPANINRVWVSLLEKIFNKKADRLTEENVIYYFKADGKDIDYWIGLKTDDREDIRIKGKTLYMVAKLFGIKGNPSQKNEAWIELLTKVYSVKLANKVTKEDVIKFLNSDGKILEDWLGLPVSKIRDIRINGETIFQVGNLLGFLGKFDNIYSVWLKILNSIYGGLDNMIGDITREDVVVFFKKDNKTINDWKGLTIDKRRNILIKGKTLHDIAKVFELKLNPISHKKGWYQLLEKIFEVKVINELTKRDVIEYFKTGGKIITDWESFSILQIKGIKIKGKTLASAVKFFGLVGDPGNDKSIFQELLKRVFNESINVSKQDIISYFKANGKTIDDWKKLSRDDRKILLILGLPLIEIAEIFGIENYTNIKAGKWIELLEKIFEMYNV